MNRKLGAVPLLGGELRPHLTTSPEPRFTSLPSGILIHPFGHNRHGPELGWGDVPFFLGIAGSPLNTVAWPRPTSTSSGILVHPAVWPQRTLAENLGLCPFRGGELVSHLTQCRVNRGLPPYQVASWSMQPFGHKRREPQIGGGGSAPFCGESWVPI